MIMHSFREAFRLISRSRRESALFLAASAASSVLYILACLALGIRYDYQTTFDALKAGQFRALLAMLPGILILTWLSAGLFGRLAMDALKGAPESLTAYAKAWFPRFLAGSLLLNGGFMAVLLLFSAVPRPVGLGLMAGWSVFCVWLLVRVSLWQASMFMDALPPLQAMRRSYAVSCGSALALGVIVFLPYLVTSSLMELASRLQWTGPAYLTVARDVLEDAVVVLTAGAYAAAYLKLRAPAEPAAVEITGEQK